MPVSLEAGIVVYEFGCFGVPTLQCLLVRLAEAADL